MQDFESEVSVSLLADYLERECLPRTASALALAWLAVTEREHSKRLALQAFADRLAEHAHAVSTRLIPAARALEEALAAGRTSSDSRGSLSSRVTDLEQERTEIADLARMIAGARSEEWPAVVSHYLDVERALLARTSALQRVHDASLRAHETRPNRRVEDERDLRTIVSPNRDKWP